MSDRDCARGDRGRGDGVRWESLFADLEGEFDAAQAAERAAELADRSRREVALVGLADRMRPAIGHQVRVLARGSGALTGTLREVGPDWLLLAETAGRQALVAGRAVMTVAGLGALTATPGSEGLVGARLNLRYALRGLARDRAPVALILVDGTTVGGTLDRVGLDHVELAEHAQGEARRVGTVRQVLAVPLTALAVVRST